jgi:creatinine amidohydrolase
LSITAREIRAQTGTPTLVVSWDDLETAEMDTLTSEVAGGHGGELETSIHLYLQPGLVHMERAVADFGGGAPKAYAGYEPGGFSRDRADPGYSETGIFGDPTLADAEKGRKALEILTREWLAALRGFSEAAVRR